MRDDGGRRGVLTAIFGTMLPVSASIGAGRRQRRHLASAEYGDGAGLIGVHSGGVSSTGVDGPDGRHVDGGGGRDNGRHGGEIVRATLGRADVV